MKKWFLSLSLLFAFQVQAQTLLVSDIDDTLKLAHVKDLTDLARYAFDDQSHFTGMSDLYAALKFQDPELQIVYLTKAPEWLMGSTHRRFLQKNQFPSGVYWARSQYSADSHKLQSLRELLRDKKPKKVIFIGDNGEQDSAVYSQIAQEFSGQGIVFFQFIRWVYASNKFDGKGSHLAKNQVGFVTPLEIALELQKNQLLDTDRVQELMNRVGNNIILQRSYGSEGDVAFPYYMNCRDFEWKWDEFLSQYEVLSKLKIRLLDRCQIKVIN